MIYFVALVVWLLAGLTIGSLLGRIIHNHTDTD
jgi:hypothetical protein